MIGTDMYLGPAKVLEIAGAERVRLELPGGPAWARLALAVPFRPSVGDEVLAITHDFEAVYVVGVLSAGSRTTLRVEGDLAIEARKIELRAPEVGVRAGKFDVLAHRMVEKVRDLYTWVSELFQIRSRRFRAVSESTMHLKAYRAYLKADTDVNVDGKSINLG